MEDSLEVIKNIFNKKFGKSIVMSLPQKSLVLQIEILKLILGWLVLKLVIWKCKVKIS